MALKWEQVLVKPDMLKDEWVGGGTAFRYVVHNHSNILRPKKSRKRDKYFDKFVVLQVDKKDKAIVKDEEVMELLEKTLPGQVRFKDVSAIKPAEKGQVRKGKLNNIDQTVPPEVPPLRKYKRIHVIDLGGPGSGHQAAVVKLLASIARIGFNGSVILSYNARKTRIYARRFGKADAYNNPEESYGLHYDPWDGTYPTDGQGDHKLNIQCIPYGGLTIKMSATEENIFCGEDNGQTPEGIKKMWTKHAWPNAEGADYDEGRPAKGFKAQAIHDAKYKYSKHNPKLPDNQIKFQEQITKQETGASMVQNSELKPLAQIEELTLTCFGAMDFHPNTQVEADHANFKQDYFDNHWLPEIKRLTPGEENPTTVILQPFLWSGGHPMQVRGGGLAQPLDIVQKVSDAGGVATYLWKAGDPSGDTGVINQQPTIAKAILRNAKANNIHLVTVYYGESVSQISHVNLFKVLATVYLSFHSPKPVVVALLGDESKTAHSAAVSALNKDKKELAALTDAWPQMELDKDEFPDIQLTHIGRTPAMQQFQRYSELFITEGANTWQEVLTLGTPSLSSCPTGNTQPWMQDVGTQTTRDIVNKASEALIDSQDDTKSVAAIAKIKDFIVQARTADSAVKTYFKAWTEALAKAESDQVATAMRNLPRPPEIQ